MARLSLMLTTTVLLLFAVGCASAELLRQSSNTLKKNVDHGATSNETAVKETSPRTHRQLRHSNNNNRANYRNHRRNHKRRHSTSNRRNNHSGRTRHHRRYNSHSSSQNRSKSKGGRHKVHHESKRHRRSRHSSHHQHGSKPGVLKGIRGIPDNNDNIVNFNNNGRPPPQQQGRGPPQQGRGPPQQQQQGRGGSTTCTSDPDSIPHMAGRWREGFPFDAALPTPLCNGRISFQRNNDICVDGRVTYQQILDALGGEVFYVPSSSTVSIQGLMITGQGNVGFGPTWRYFNDFVTSYTIEGVTYNGGPAITDRTFVASRGAIDSFCLDSSIRRGPEYFQVSVDRYSPFDLQANAREIEDATAVYITFVSMTVEYHRALREDDFDPDDLIVPEEESLGDGLFDATVMRNIPGAFSALGLIRSIQQPGIYATRNFPNGQYDGDLLYTTMEQIQIDTEWTTFLSMVSGGFFDDNPPPVGLVVAVKHIFADRNSNGCWKEETAGMAMAVPIGSADDLEEYVTQVYEAIARRGGTLTLHFGKRMPANREIIRAALRKLESCGVQTNVNPVRCLHPMCRRTDRVGSFTWPAKYYAF